MNVYIERLCVWDQGCSLQTSSRRHSSSSLHICMYAYLYVHLYNVDGKDERRNDGWRFLGLLRRTRKESMISGSVLLLIYSVCMHQSHSGMSRQDEKFEHSGVFSFMRTMPTYTKLSKNFMLLFSLS
jgi:hypothetical protein